MKKLLEELSKNGYKYILVQRDQNKALYRQVYKNVLVGYEVFRIRIQRARFSHILGRHIPESERFPCNEDFGRSAWAYMDLDNAVIRYYNII